MCLFQFDVCAHGSPTFAHFAEVTYENFVFACHHVTLLNYLSAKYGVVSEKGAAPEAPR